MAPLESPERFDHTEAVAAQSFFARLIHRFSHRFVEEEHRARYAFASQYVRGKRVLDIACGEGYGAAMLREAGAQSVMAGDKESVSIDLAREKYASAGVAYQTMDAEALTLPRQSFDMVVSFETIEHLERPERLLESLQAIATDRADIFISTPNRRVSNPGTTLEDRPRNPFHIREYTPEEFQALLEKYFVVRQLLGQGIYTRTRHRLVQRLERLLKAILVVLPGGSYFLARVHPLSFLAEPTYVIAHCVNSRRA